MKCSFCGKEYVPGSRYCHGCFAKVEDAFGIVSKIPSRKEKIEDKEIEILIIEDEIEKKEKIDKNPVIEKKEKVDESSSIDKEEDDFITLLNIPVEEEKKEESVIEDDFLEQLNVPLPIKENQVVEEKSNKISVDVPKQEIVKEQKKNDSRDNRRLGISIVILIFVVVLAGFITWNSTNKNENPKSEVINLANEDNTIVFASYTLTLPDGFIYNIYNGTDYIQNDDVVIMFKEEAPLGYQFVVDNKESIIASLDSQGLKVRSFEEKEYKGNKFVTIVGEKTEGNDIKEYGYVFGDLSNEKPVCATIRSKSMDKFNEEWFIYAMEFLSTAK